MIEGSEVTLCDKDAVFDLHLLLIVAVVAVVAANAAVAVVAVVAANCY